MHPDQVTAIDAVPQTAQTDGRAFARRSRRVRQDEWRAKAKGVSVILCSFAALLAGALLAGGQGVIDPLLGTRDALEAKRVGDIVYALPDGTYCRHLSFDNMTAELTEGSIEHCKHNPSGEHHRNTSGFAWGAR